MAEAANADAAARRTEDIAERYAVVRTLKSGNGVETLLAVDTRTGSDVVVKWIDPVFVPLAARLSFEHETQVLRHLTGAGLVGLHDAGQSGGRLYLVQPFVPGPASTPSWRTARSR